MLRAALSAGVLLVIDLAALLTIWAPDSSNTAEKTHPALTRVCLDGADGSAGPVGTEPALPISVNTVPTKEPTW